MAIAPRNRAPSAEVGRFPGRLRGREAKLSAEIKGRIQTNP